MKALTTVKTIRKWLASFTLVTFSATGFAGVLPPLVDNFSDSVINNLGIPRQYLNDTLAGGSTQTEQNAADGILYLRGALVPPRGQPGWASTVLPLDPTGAPQDASRYEGIRLVIKVKRGNVTVSANSTLVTNFDYHSAPISVAADGKFHEVKIPFNSMRRAWSEQTELDAKTLGSLSITAFSLQKGLFAFEVDEVSFYKN